LGPLILDPDPRTFVLNALSWVLIPIILSAPSFRVAARGQTVESESAKRHASDADAGDQFGDAVATSGELIVVGSPFDDDAGPNSSSGSAYIFGRDQGGTNQWGLIKKITANDAGAGDQFGWSVAVNGTTVVVGAYQAPTTLPGLAYVFERDQGGSNQWGQIKKLTAFDAAAGDQFGWSVAINGDRIAVGAHHDDDMVNNIGSVYLFGRDVGGSNQWGLLKKIMPEDGAGDDDFGESVSLSADTLAVGVSGDDDLFSNGGSVYLFDRNQGGEDHWGLVKKVFADDEDVYDQFGESVALEGDTLVVGANLDDNPEINGGSAYVFERNTGGANQWGQVKHLTANAREGDQFGTSVALSGDFILVGATFGDGITNDSGAAFLFQRNEGGPDQWGLTRIFEASDGDGIDKFGEAVALSGKEAVVGAAFDDDTFNRSGSAYLFAVPGNAPPPPTLSIEDGEGEVVISWSPATAGYVLEVNSSLAPAGWKEAGSGETNPARQPKTDAVQFFRLRHP
jgi:FG-GAP repeat